MNLRIKLVSTRRSDVLCTACNQFHADHVIVRANGEETDYGVHKRCAGSVQVKFTRRRRSELSETGT
jgi:hypothetical protein